MKNLFSINMTDNPEATDLDQNPYVAAHVSDEVRYKLEHIFDDLKEDKEPADTEETAADRRLLRRYWILCVSFLGAALLLFFAGDKTGIFDATPALAFLPLPVLAVGIVFNFKAKRLSSKINGDRMSIANMDFTEATARLEEASAAAARELGIPDDAVSLEVFTYHYKLKGDAEVNVGKRRLDNIAVSAWVKDDVLHLTTAQELFRIPLSDIRGHREIDEEFVIDYWLKEEEPDSERYAAFNIRKAGFTAKKCRLYYAVDINGAHGAYEFFIPCYDWSVFEGLVGKMG